MSIASGKFSTIGSINLPTAHPIAIAVAPNGNFLYVSTTAESISTPSEQAARSNWKMLRMSSRKISANHAGGLDKQLAGRRCLRRGSTQRHCNQLQYRRLASAGESEIHVNLPVTTVMQLAISPGDSSSCNDCYVFVALVDGGIEFIGFNPGQCQSFRERWEQRPAQFRRRQRNSRGPYQPVALCWRV